MIRLHGNTRAILVPGERPGAPRRLHLIRHGETDLNARGVLQGSIDAELNDRGRAQAAQAARALQELGLRRIVSSPQRRALQTAGIIAAHLGLPITTDAVLRERHWGECEGKPRDARSLDGVGVEPIAALQARARAALRHVSALPEVETLVVSHGGLMREMLALLGCAPAGSLRNCEIISVSLDMPAA